MRLILSSHETAEAYVEAYQAGRSSARPTQPPLVRVIEGVAWASMAAAFALFLALIAQVFGIDPMWIGDLPGLAPIR
jgi:hypothetical protein